MSRSSNSSLVTLVLFLLLCPPTWGQQVKPEVQKQKAVNQNTVKVHSVTMLEDRTGKICFEISVKCPTKEVSINLDNVTDLKMVEDTMDVITKKQEKKQFGYHFEGKLLKLKLDKGDYLLEYVDTTITFAAPQYKVELQKEGTNSKISGNLTVTNRTCYPWCQNTKIKLVKENQVHTLIASLEARHEPKEKIYLPFEEKSITNKIAQYSVSITEFEGTKAHPSLVVDLKQAWPQSPVYYQLPGKIQVCVDRISRSYEFEADKFTSITTNPKLSLFKNKDLQVNRSDTYDAVVILDNTDKNILKSKFCADYDYEYTSRSILEISFEITPKIKIDLKSGKSERLTHVTTLPELNLLIETDDPLLGLAPKLTSIQKELMDRINLTAAADRNISSQVFITEQTNQLNTLTYINMVLTNARFSIMLDLINQTLESIAAAKKQLKSIDLKKTFPKIAEYPVTYLPSKGSDFRKLIVETQKKNTPVLTRLSLLATNATKMSTILKAIPSQSEYQETIRRLAALGVRDADVTLLRKQRTEQKKLAKSFMHVYNTLVLESAEVFPIHLKSPPNNRQANSASPSLTSPDVRVQSLQN